MQFQGSFSIKGFLFHQRLPLRERICSIRSSIMFSGLSTSKWKIQCNYILNIISLLFQSLKPNISETMFQPCNENVDCNEVSSECHATTDPEVNLCGCLLGFSYIPDQFSCVDTGKLVLATQKKK